MNTQKALLQQFLKCISFFLFPTSVFCYLSQSEELWAIQKFAPPATLQAQLDNFFSHDENKSFFITRPRCQYLPKSGSRQLSPQARTQWTLHQKNVRELWNNQFEKQYHDICEKFFLTPLTGLDKNNTFILDSKSCWPGFILKISKDEWAIPHSDRSASIIRYKNVSRIFYNDKLQEFITKTNAKHLLCLKKYLYHLPGQPDEISDRNYCIIAEKFENLPSEEENEQAIKALFDFEQKEVKEAFIPIIKELVQATFYTGIADLRAHNIFLITYDNTLKFLFIDTERHGFYDSDENFFHKNAHEIKTSAERGIFNLCKSTLQLCDRDAHILAAKLQKLVPPQPQSTKKCDKNNYVSSGKRPSNS